jgi:hypothetical protein
MKAFTSLISTLMVVALLLFAGVGVWTAVVDIQETLAEDITIPVVTPPVGTPLPMTGPCTPTEGEVTIPNLLPGGGWTAETRFYDAGDPRPEHFDGRASGTFDLATSCGAFGSQKVGYDEVRVEITRRGLGVVVEVDVIRHGKEGP